MKKTLTREARPIGPTERLCVLRTIGWPLRSIDIEPGQITTSALIDCRETLRVLVDENTHAIMDASSLMHEARKPLFEDRMALTRVLILLNRKISGRSDHADGRSTARADALEGAPGASRQERRRS